MLPRIDWLFLGIALVLTLFGLAMVSSVSVFESYQLTQKFVVQGLRDEPSNAFYLWRSFMHVVVGLGVLAVMACIPYRVWERFARSIYLLNLGLLVALFIPGIGNEYGTARSWIHLGFFSVQPSEFFKLAYIFYLSVWLQKREPLIATFKEGFLPFVTLLVLSTLLVALQPDLGSFLIFTSVGAVMFFVAGGSLFHLMLGGGAAAILGLPIILNEDYVRNRFLAFLRPDDPSIAEGIGFQIKQALIAIGSGGLFGVGYGKSIQKFGYLPEVQSDTIFAAMAEELGFLRLLIVLGMYGVLVYRGYAIARQAPDRFGFMVATGITTWIAVQTILNVSVNLALFPLTGLTLPFISYGGSSLLVLLAAVGVMLNISSSSIQEQVRTRRRSSGKMSDSLRRFVHG